MTRLGALSLGLLVPLSYVAAASGNNLLYLLVAMGIVVWCLQLFLGPYNLRGLEVARQLPGELYATRPGAGRLVLRNTRRLGESLSITVTERGEGRARAVFPSIGVGREETRAASWTFDDRGEAHLGDLEISSAFPFGLVRHIRRVPLWASVLVYPQPLSRVAIPTPAAVHLQGEDGRREGTVGDFVGLRPYRPGDPLRAIHWKTSARTQVPMVLQRSTPSGDDVTIRVADVGGTAWERALERATGQLLGALVRGARICVEVPGHGEVGPLTGQHARQAGLALLARAPRR